MKNWKTMLALAASLSLCAAMVGCGDSGKKDSSSKRGNSSVVTEDKNGGLSGGSDTNSPDDSKDSETSEAPDKDGSAYAYYDELAAEWDKTGDNRTVLLYVNAYAPYAEAARYENKIIFADKLSGEEITIFVYDLDSKEVSTFTIPQSNHTYFHNGYVYCRWSTPSRDKQFTKKYDLSGNEVDSIDKSIHFNFVVTESGYVFGNYAPNINFDEQSKNAYSVITPDFSELITLPSPKKKDAHGIESDLDSNYRAIAAYGNKVFVIIHDSYVNAEKPYNVGKLCYLDLDTMTWNESKCPETENVEWCCTDNADGPRNFAPVIGKFCFLKIDKKTYLYNMETDEISAEPLPNSNETAFYKTYFGGKYNIVRSGDKFYRVQLPLGADSVKIEDTDAVALGTDSQKGIIYMVDDTYYIFKDDAGIFLRTYEKGETEEEVVCVFNN